MNHPHALRTVLALFLGCCIPFVGNADKKDEHSKNKEPYTMSLLALKGPGSIVVYITIQSSDSGGCPVPTEIEKLKVKFLDTQSNIRVVKNEFDVPLVNGVATFTDTDALGALLVEVKALVRTGDNEQEENDSLGHDEDKKKGHEKEKKHHHSDSDFGDCEEHEVVLKGKISVLLRPDLIVDKVNAPQQVNVNTPFSVEAVIREVNTQVGATATVSLWEGSTLLGSIPGVHVPAGGQVSVVFQGLTASTSGTHEYTIKISDADPAEYDVTNNDRSFSVLVMTPAAAMSYSMYYQRLENYNYHYWQTSTCYGGYDYTATGRTENLQFYGYATPPNGLHGPFDRIRWSVENESGLVARYDTSNLAPTSTYDGGDGSYQDNYQVNDGTHFYFDLFVGMYYNGSTPNYYVNFQLTRYSSNYVYVYHFSDGTTSSYAVSDPDSVFINASSLVSLKVALEDDGYMTGGQAVLSVQPSQPISGSYSSSYFDGCGTTSYGADYHYDLFEGSGSGVTDSTQLPSVSAKSIQIAGLAENLPSEIRLERNYPNPFNPSTTVRFQLPENQRVKITVFNTLGQEIQILVDGEIAAGYHSVVWNAGSTPSGVYFVRMNAGPYHFTQRAILVK